MPGERDGLLSHNSRGSDSNGDRRLEVHDAEGLMVLVTVRNWKQILSGVLFHSSRDAAASREPPEGEIPNGTVVELLGVEHGCGWARIRWKGDAIFVRQHHIQLPLTGDQGSSEVAYWRELEDFEAEVDPDNTLPSGTVAQLQEFNADSGWVRVRWEEQAIFVKRENMSFKNVEMVQKPVCMRPVCGKPTWNGQPNEFCSIKCKKATPTCKKPDCGKPAWNGHPGYCSMKCQSETPLCMLPSCSKPTWNDRPHGFCSLQCIELTKPFCMMQQCGKPTWNGKAGGFCSLGCRDLARRGEELTRVKELAPEEPVGAFRSEDNAKGLRRRAFTAKGRAGSSGLESRIAKILRTKFDTLSTDEQEQLEKRKMDAKHALMKAQNGKELLDLAERWIEEDWLAEVKEIPGNVYRIAAFGRLPDTQNNRMKTMTRIVGWFMIWLIQVFAPPLVFLSTWLQWGLDGETRFKWENWSVDLTDWQTISSTKGLSLVFIACYVLNGLFVVMEEMDASAKIHSIIRFIKYFKPEAKFGWRGFLYLGAVTNCWAIIWCCIDTICVLGGARKPKDLIYDSLGLLFLHNIDDIGGDLGFMENSEWPGLRISWIFSELVEEDWGHGIASSFDKEKRGCGGRAIFVVYKITIFLLAVFSVAFPAFCAITKFADIGTMSN